MVFVDLRFAYKRKGFRFPTLRANFSPFNSKSVGYCVSPQWWGRIGGVGLEQQE